MSGETVVRTRRNRLKHYYSVYRHRYTPKGSKVDISIYSRLYQAGKLGRLSANRKSALGVRNAARFTARESLLDLL